MGRRVCCALAALFAALTWLGHVRAAENEYPVPPVRYAPSPYLLSPFLLVMDSDVPDAARVEISLIFSQLNDPWRVPDSNGDDVSPIEHLQMLRPTLVYSPGRWFDMALSWPLSLHFGGSERTVAQGEIPGEGVHLLSPELLLRVPVSRIGRRGMGLALVGRGVAPIGDDASFLGDPGRYGDAFLVAYWRYGRFSAGVNAGLVLRKSTGVVDGSVGNEVVIRPGLSYEFVAGSFGVGLSAEANLAGPPGNPLSGDPFVARQFLLSLVVRPLNAWSGVFGAVGGWWSRLGDAGQYGTGDARVDARFGYAWVRGHKGRSAGSGREPIEYASCEGFPYYKFRCGVCQPEMDLEWDFGDGSAIVHEKQPEHIYDTPGTYVVLLLRRGILIAEKTVEVAATPRPLSIRSMTCEPERPMERLCAKDGVPIVCSFSSNARRFDSVEWDWGDGGTSFGQEGKHTYEEAGQYTIRLNAISCGREVELVLDEPLWMDCCDCERFKVADFYFPVDCPLPEPEDVGAMPAVGGECQGFTAREQWQLVGKRHRLTEILAQSSVRVLVVSYADICYQGSAQQADEYNDQLSRRRAEKVLDLVRSTLGEGDLEIRYYVAATGRHCANPGCDCNAPESRACARDRKVEVYIDFGNQDDFVCPATGNRVCFDAQ